MGLHAVKAAITDDLKAHWFEVVYESKEAKNMPVLVSDASGAFYEVHKDEIIERLDDDTCGLSSPQY